jgi:hypothetical protein
MTAGARSRRDIARLAIAASCLVLAGAGYRVYARQPTDVPSAAMTFFVTSVGRGFGGNLGGLAGADNHCQRLAESVGRAAHTWRAYLSVPATATRPAVHARDRIGKGPWVNAAGVRIAADVQALHDGEHALGRENSLTEKGTTIAPGRHDILTGSNPDGTLAIGPADTTCAGWTTNDNAGRAMLGHHNRSGGGQRPDSWNSAHLSRGCSQNALRASLGDGLFYCFAAD